MRPPAEYLGLARALRWRVQASDDFVNPIIDAALRPLRERLRRHPGRPLREGDLIDARRTWRSTPAYGRIGQSIDITDRHKPAFRELRISAVRFSTALWDGGDADELAVSLIFARMERGKLVVHPAILGACSLHGLARRIERARDRSDEAVFADLSQLAFAYPQMVDDASDKFVLSVSDGQWAGSLLQLDGRPAALAQTWLSDAHEVTVPEAASHDLDALVASLPSMVIAQ